jgi:hypothetical protein
MEFLMNSEFKKVRNPIYLWMSRIALWGTVLFSIPLFLLDTYTYKTGSAIGNTLTLLFHCYIAVANYILGYRFDAPPKWSRWLVRDKWIVEWRYLIYADPAAIKSNRNGLLRVVAGGTLLTILLLAFLSGKL